MPRENVVTTADTGLWSSALAAFTVAKQMPTGARVCFTAAFYHQAAYLVALQNSR